MSTPQPSSPPSPQTIIEGYITQITPSFNFVVGLTAFAASLFTALIVLFAFSTRSLRRRLVFRLNVMAIAIAMVLSILNGVLSGSTVLKPFTDLPQSLYVATIFFAIYPPLFYDSILLTRLFALYPVATTPKLTLIKIFSFPVCVKCGRLVVLSLYLNQFVKATTSLQSLVQYSEATWFRNPYITAEWTMQMFDNLYCVSFFLYQLHSRAARIKPIGVTGFTDRLRRVFFISAANFVFPLFFNLAQIICITTSHSFATGTMLMLVNSYVSVIGVLCATIWSIGSEWVRTHRPALTTTTTATTMTGTGTEYSERSAPVSTNKRERFVSLRVDRVDPDEAAFVKKAGWRDTETRDSGEGSLGTTPPGARTGMDV